MNSVFKTTFANMICILQLQSNHTSNLDLNPRWKIAILLRA